jgi:hypothetical protein
MIFALGEDGELQVFVDLAGVRATCEGIDVESNVWDFFDQDGLPLEPVFSQPNQKASIFGLFSVWRSGVFDLVPTDDRSCPTLLGSLIEGIRLRPNSHFASIDEVRSYLIARSVVSASTERRGGA